MIDNGVCDFYGCADPERYGLLLHDGSGIGVCEEHADAIALVTGRHVQKEGWDAWTEHQTGVPQTTRSRIVSRKFPCRCRLCSQAVKTEATRRPPEEAS